MTIHDAVTEVEQMPQLANAALSGGVCPEVEFAEESPEGDAALCEDCFAVASRFEAPRPHFLHALLPKSIFSVFYNP